MKDERFQVKRCSISLSSVLDDMSPDWTDFLTMLKVMPDSLNWVVQKKTQRENLATENFSAKFMKCGQNVLPNLWSSENEINRNSL